MHVYHINPGAAWLQYKDGWFLVVARDGRVTDWDLGSAIYLVDRATAEVCEAEAGDVDFEFYVRRVWLDTGRGACVSCDLLIHHDEPEGVEETVERVVRSSLDVLTEPADWMGEPVSYDLMMHRIDYGSDDFSQHGQAWFERFLPKSSSSRNPS